MVHIHTVTVAIDKIASHMCVGAQLQYFRKNVYAHFIAGDP